MIFLLLTSHLLLGSSIICFTLTKKSLRTHLIFTGIVALHLALSAAWLAINNITGNGINGATIFHLYYGFLNAGAIYDRLPSVLLTATGLLIFIFLAKKSTRWGQLSLIRPRFLSAAFILVIGALSCHPAIKNLAQLNWPTKAAKDFYENYHRPIIQRIAPRPKSFIFIYGESLERTYLDNKLFPSLVPELQQLEKSGISFTNIDSLPGTGFTMGGFVASNCAIPLITPSHPNSMSGMDTFLPGAIGLSDLLHQESYRLAFMGGADLNFGGKGKFLHSHHFDEVLGRTELEPKLKDPTYINGWGLYDDSLFDLAYDRYTELAANHQPFGLFLLTLNTHSPHGLPSKTDALSPYGDGSNQMLTAVKTSAHHIAQFVRRVQASTWGKDTVIVIISDHIAMPNEATALLDRGIRKNLFLILDPKIKNGASIPRLGSTLDIGPTLLPFLGFTGSIGLGRNLLDPNVLDSDIAHIHDPAVLESWHDNLVEFWDFPRLGHRIHFKAGVMTINKRPLSAPVLITLNQQDELSLRFEFDAEWDVRLAEQARQLPQGTRYLLFAKEKDIATNFPRIVTGQSDRWILLLGRAGAGTQVIALSETTETTLLKTDLLARWDKLR